MMWEFLKCTDEIRAKVKKDPKCVDPKPEETDKTPCEMDFEQKDPECVSTEEN